MPTRTFLVRTLTTLTSLVILPTVGLAQLAPNEMRAHFISVGQGDATLLEFSCGVMMIDAGGLYHQSDADLITYLNGVFASRPNLNRTIEAIFLTHRHTDHAQALPEVTDNFTVRRLIDSHRGWQVDLDSVLDDVDDGTLTIDVIDIDDADVVDANGAGVTSADIDPINCTGGATNPEIHILSADLDTDPGWDESGDDFDNPNNHSLVVRVEFGAASFLFTGDLEEPAIETMVLYYEDEGQPDMLNVDVYQVGHHGSRNGTTDWLMDAMSPRVAIISMSAWDVRGARTGYGYGHPTRRAYNMLANNSSGVSCNRDVAPDAARVSYRSQGRRRWSRRSVTKAVYATGWDGHVVVTAWANGDLDVTPGGLTC